jgi:hypothetical protein
MTNDQLETMKIAGMVMLGILLLALLATGGKRRCDKHFRDEVEDFARHFPGVCMICSYYRYGVLHGFISSECKPPAHRCIEDHHDPRPQD